MIKEYKGIRYELISQDNHGDRGGAVVHFPDGIPADRELAEDICLSAYFVYTPTFAFHEEDNTVGYHGYFD